MWIEREGIHTNGLQWDVVKRCMGRRVGREIGQDLQVCFDPGEKGQVYEMIRGSLTGSKTNIADVRANTANVRQLWGIDCKTECSCLGDLLLLKRL